MLKAPWTDEQVKNLNDYQNSGRFHPFTCGNCRNDLVALNEGWTCPTPDCGYTQDWAHEFMAQPLPPLDNPTT